MLIGLGVVPDIAGSLIFSEVDGPSRLVPLVQIGRLRLLMLTFADEFVLAGVGPLVARRLDLDAGLRYERAAPFITMLDVYLAARSVGLIALQNGREVPMEEFVANARTLRVVHCTTCGVGDLESDDCRCWVCDAREEQRLEAGALANHRGVKCRQ
ncbi:MAG: hypothetical protein AAB473_02610 [Patescibacteria group bacterium]